jgi:predicted ATPase/class 3 adenylate cyclase
MSSLSDWLNRVGLSELEPVFLAQQIDLDVVVQLTEADMRELGLNIGQRKRLRLAIADLASFTELSRPPVPESAVHGAERRHLTVMFCDLVGSSALSEQLETEDYLKVLQAYRAFCVQTVNRFEGFVASFSGDGILCYFGYPLAHENDAERAVRAALAIAGGVRLLRTAAPAPIQVRVGLTTGTVIIGDGSGQGWPGGQDIVGAAPNLAARIQAVAEPGEVLVAESTYRLVRSVFVCDPRGARTVKGFVAPTSLWRVVTEKRVGPRLRARRGRRRAPMVDRVAELAELRARWERCLTGGGAGVVVIGEAGIGKSRLVEHFTDQLGETPAFVHRFVADSFSASTPLAPLVEMLTRAAMIRPADDAATRRRKLERIVLGDEGSRARGLPVMADLLSITRLGEEAALSATQVRERTFAFLVEQAHRAAEVGPVLLLVEDLHWLDPTSLELLEQMIARLDGHRIMLVLTCRDSEQTEWITRSGLATIRLERLGLEDSRTLIQTVLGDRLLDPVFEAQIVSKTDGNPLFLEEFTSSVADNAERVDSSGRSGAAGLPVVPSNLQELLVARLDQAGEHKALAQVGSVIGRSFLRPLLDTVAAGMVADIEAGLAGLVDAGLIYEEITGVQRAYHFKHALVQDAAYGTLVREDRARLHARTAEALEALQPNARREQPELLAHHLAAAGKVAEAVPCWIAAAEKSLQRSSLQEAVAQLRGCLDLLATLPATTRHLEQRLKVLVLLGPALISLKGPGSAEVEEVYTSAYETSLRLPESRSHFPVYWGWWRMSRDYNDKTRRYLALLERAEGRGDPEMMLQAHHCAWGSTFGLGRFDECCGHIHQGLAIYEAGDYRQHATLYGNHDAKVCGHGELALVHWLRGEPERALREERKAMAWANEIAHDGSFSHFIDIAVMHSTYRRDLTAVRERATTMLELAEEKGFADHLSKGRIFLGWAMAHAGEAPAGLELLRAGLARQLDSGTVEDLPVYYSLLAEVLQKTGHLDSALEELRTVHEICDRAGLKIWLPDVRRRMGELMQMLDPRSREAAGVLRESLAEAEAQGARALAVRSALSLARHLARAGAREQAAAVIAPYLSGTPEWLRKGDVAAARAFHEALGRGTREIGSDPTLAAWLGGVSA